MRDPKHRGVNEISLKVQNRRANTEDAKTETWASGQD